MQFVTTTAVAQLFSPHPVVLYMVRMGWGRSQQLVKLRQKTLQQSHLGEFWTNGRGLTDYCCGVVLRVRLEPPACCASRNKGGTGCRPFATRRSSCSTGRYGPSRYPTADGSPPARSSLVPQGHTLQNLEERARLEAAGGTFTDGRLFGRLVPTRTFGNQDVRR